jgi:hypothetical protein
MNAIDSFPDPALPLRAKLPNFSDSTRVRLASWAEAQGRATRDNREWLLDRTVEYADKFPFTSMAGQMNLDAWSGLILATAALDLLKWRTTSRDDRDAAEHLAIPMSNEQ